MERRHSGGAKSPAYGYVADYEAEDDAMYRNAMADDDVPLLNDAPNDQVLVTDERQRKWNIASALIGISLLMTGYSVFNDSYNQWLYVRYEMDVLGENFTKANITASSDPCDDRTNHSDPLAKQLDLAQSKASAFISLTTLVALGAAIFVNIALGSLANKKGRKMLFIIPALGYAMKIGVACVVANWNLDLSYLYIGMVIESVTGSLVAIFMAISIYMADNTESSGSRSYGMVVSQAGSNIFFSLTHLAIGYFISAEGYVWPLFTSFLLCILSVLWFTFCVNETVEKSDFKNCQERTEAVKGIFSFYLKKSENPKYKRKDFMILVAIFFLFGSSLGAQFQSMFLMDEPLCWGSRQIGYVLTFQGLIQSLVSLTLMPLMQRVMSDEVITLIAMLSACGARGMLAFSVHNWMVYVAFAIGMFELIVTPGIRGILSKMVPADKQGSLFASVAVIEVATIAVSGAGVNQFYSHTVQIWHGLGYAFIAGCLFIAAVMMLMYIIILQHRPAVNEVFIIKQSLAGRETSHMTINTTTSGDHVTNNSATSGDETS